MSKKAEVIVCALLMLLCCVGCSMSAKPCESNKLCDSKASCRADTGWCDFWESELKISPDYQWKDAVVGQPYAVEFQASGGFQPYTWVLNDGDTGTYPSWLELAPDGDNHEKAILRNKVGTTILPGDITTSGEVINIKITVFDNTKRDTTDRHDNKGDSVNAELKVKQCSNDSCVDCTNNQNKCEQYSANQCVVSTDTLQKCSLNNDGCLVWQDQQQDACSGYGTCAVAGDGAVTCTCTTGFAGDTCNQCAAEYIGYPDCHIPTSGEVQTITIEGVVFKMMYVPGGTFPTGTDDLPGSEKTVVEGFWMGETEVTYEMWYKVYLWATATAANKYTFANKGVEGSSGTAGAIPKTTGAHAQPVTTVNWRDAMVWCNAASEMLGGEAAGYEPVYKNGSGVVIRNSTDDNSSECDNVTPSSTATGFRLPDTWQWECAARYQGNNIWTPGNHVSGDTTGCCYSTSTNTCTISNDFGSYAWYTVNAPSSTKGVATRIPNALSIYDMSGNVYEWCFNRSSSVNNNRVIRGGSFFDYSPSLQVGSKDGHYESSSYIGFRLVRTK
jgi:formylglycine-generating enzyme required for sulfatase activity